MAWAKFVEGVTDVWQRSVDTSGELIDKAGTAASDAWDSSESARKNAAERVGRAATGSWEGAKRLGNNAASQAAAATAFLSQVDLLKWSEAITQSGATIYDKAMDATYLRDHIGGGNHRMFDGGHTLTGAWERVREASETDSLSQEVIGYVSGIWKDLTTSKGLPFATWEKADYDQWSSWAAERIPGVDKEFFYDLLSFDAFELLASGLGAVALVFAFDADDKKKLSEILGSMGIISILSANPIMGLAVIATSAYAYFIKKRELDGRTFVSGGVIGAVSLGVFAVLGLPLLVELVIAMVLAGLLKKYVLSRSDLMEMLATSAREVGLSVSQAVSRVLRNVGLASG